MGGRLSRRAFLGTAGAAALVAVPRSPLAGAREAAPDVERVRADVAVVGGGISGVVAGRDLSRKGLSVTVLDGGTVEDDASDLDLWVIDDHSRLGRLAGRAGGLRRIPTGGPTLEAVADGARPLAEGEWSADGRAASQIASAFTKLDRMAKEVDLDAPWAAVNAAVRDTHTLGSWLDGSVAGDTARRRLDGGFELALGAPTSEVSLLFALVAVGGAGGAEPLLASWYRPSHEVEGGLARVRGVLANSSQASVRHGAAHTVTSEGGEAVVSAPDCLVEARRVVVSDLSVASVAGATPRRFVPDQMAVVRCTYPWAPWPNDGLSGRVLGDAAPVHAVHPTADRRTLVAVIAGGSARDWLRRSEADRRDAVLGALERWVGRRAADPVGYEETSGSTGTRVVAPLGAITSLGPELRGPVGPVCWAGAETAREWTGHAEGLVEAGERAAADVVASLEV